MIKSRYRQTTPNVAFKQGKTGPYPNPPSLIGWRKQLDCSCDNLKWIETFKNNCCQPVIKKIQNKNGNVDGTYSYTTGGYLQKRYRSYDQNAFNFAANNVENNQPTSTYYILGDIKDSSGINIWFMPYGGKGAPETLYVAGGSAVDCSSGETLNITGEYTLDYSTLTEVSWTKVTGDFTIKGELGMPWSITAVAGHGTGRWDPGVPMDISRNSLGVAALGGHLYAVGGYYDAFAPSNLNSVERYTPASGSWATMTPMDISRADLGIAALGGHLYAVGGTGAGTYLNSVERYTPASGSWATMTPMDISRNSLGVAALGGHLYAVGGYYDAFANLNSVERYTPDDASGSWATMTPMDISRGYLGVAALGGHLYAVGGFGAGTYLNSVERYTPDDASGSWATMTPMDISRGFLGVAALGGHLYAVGGYDAAGTYLNSVERYTPDDASGSWATMTPMDISRGYLGVAALGGHLYAVGGNAGGGAFAINSVEVYTSACSLYTNSAPFNPTIPPQQNWQIATLTDSSGICCDITAAEDVKVGATQDLFNAAIATYKKNNPAFKKQGAVSNRARLNRLKYNTIVGSMPDGKTYFGGQPPNPTIVKSKNRCFCGWGDLGPCHGQNIKCCTTFCKESFTGSWSGGLPSGAPGDVVFTVGSDVPFGILISLTSTTLVVRLYDCNGSYESIPQSEGIKLGSSTFSFPPDNVGVITEGCGPPL